MIPVRQIDRDAAADFHRECGKSPGWVQAVRDGLQDSTRTVQSFAAFRIAMADRLLNLIEDNIAHYYEDYVMAQNKQDTPAGSTAYHSMEASDHLYEQVRDLIGSPQAIEVIPVEQALVVPAMTVDERP